MGFLQRRRLAGVAALSLALHALLLAWLAWPRAPDLFANGPDLSWVSVELVAPATSAPSRTRPTAVLASSRADVAPPSATVREAPAAVASPAGAVTVPATPAAAAPGAPSDQLRAALRGGAGCVRAGSRAEREQCEERLGRLSTSTPTYAAPIDPGKRAYYDEVVAAGPSGKTYGDPKPMGAQPDGDYFRFLNCSIKFGVGKKPKDRQGEVRLGRTPCSIPLQGSFFTPEASVRKR